MILFWIAFLILVVFLLALDLGVFHKADREISVREALLWTGFWILLSMLFGGVVYFFFGTESFMQYLTGYLIEKTLSIDNVFVIAAVFSYFEIPAKYQHRVLFWGIFGAIFLRGVFIFSGLTLIHHFHWVFFVFGAILVISAVKMFVQKQDSSFAFNIDRFVLHLNKMIPMEREIHGHAFFVKRNSHWAATPLFLSLVVIELSDVIFAVDSIPAIFAVTDSTFIVFTSNIMAVLGLRSLYFALAAMLRKFSRLKYAISVILAFVGLKMLLSGVIVIPTEISLTVIFVAFLLGIL